MSKTVGDYKLVQKIGKGSFADVYKATHKKNTSEYAVKAIPKDLLSEPKLLSGLKNEIDIMKDFIHENIVQLHEYFSTEKNFYLVLELCPGGDLSKFIRKRKRLSEPVAQAFFVQLVNGLSFLHERGYIHRDLKPANCLLSADQKVLKLADFGFARELSTAALAQTRCGTPLYMAPEILEARDYDGKADVWSTGCIFYEMLVGVSPFKGTNEHDLLNNIKTKELSVPSDIKVSKPTVDILVKLLQRQPGRRASLSQLVALIGHLQSRQEEGQSDSSADIQEPFLLSDRNSFDKATFDSADSIDANTSNRLKQHQLHHQDMAIGLHGGRLPEAVDSSSNHKATSSSTLQVQQTNSPSNVHPSANTTTSQRSTSQHYHNRRNSTGSIGKQRESAYYSDDQSKRSIPSAVSVGKQNNYNSPSMNSHKGDSSLRVSPYGSSGRMQITTRNSLNSISSSPPSTSPASTMGIVGNYIASFFNPNVSVHQQQQRSMQKQYHERSVSFDHGTSQRFQNRPPSNNGSPAALNYKPRALVDTFNDMSNKSRSYSVNNVNNISNYSSSGTEDDFVMIDSSSTVESEIPSNDPSQRNKNQYRPDSANVTQRKDSEIIHNYFGDNSYNRDDKMQMSAPIDKATDPIPSNDLQSVLALQEAFFAGIVKRCEVFCPVVSSIASLGDGIIKDALESEEALNQPNSKSQDIDEVDPGFLNPTVQPNSAPNHPRSILNKYLSACSLYFHALSLLSKLRQSFDDQGMSSISNRLHHSQNIYDLENGKLSVAKLTKDLALVHTQLVQRAEECQNRVQQLLEAEKSAANGVVSSYVIPQPETLMLQAAVSREEDAGMDELLGNLVRACKLYSSAKELIDAVALTASEPEDQRKLQLYATNLHSKYSSCKQKAIDLQMI